VNRLAALSIFVVCVLLASGVAISAEGRLEEIAVHGDSLEENLIGESPDRAVTVYLPPSYDSNSDRRFPVVYFLHGVGDTNKTWNAGGEHSLQEVMDRELTAGRVQEFIMVMPSQFTKYAGSFYTNSESTGNWEDFTTKELTRYIDGRYRTLAKSASRGIAGHSMGGHGAIKLGMKYPDVYSVVYGMNPAVLDWPGGIFESVETYEAVRAAKSLEELSTGGLFAVGLVCVAQAFSPNSNRPPFFADLPNRVEGGKLVRNSNAYERWTAQMPVRMAPKYLNNLRRLRGLKFDTGWRDEFTHIPPTTRALSEVLTKLEIDHVFEEYNGDHRNRLYGEHGRLATQVLPFFSRRLDFE
jgi:S-formylglutathione hydrolase FrmB